MFTLRNFLVSVAGHSQADVLSDVLFCTEADAKRAFLANQMHESYAGYSFTLVGQGELTFSYSGRTVVSYIDRLLLMEAVYLLRNSDMSVTAIAEHLHFASQSSFTKFFVRMKGESPLAYRMGQP